MNKTLLASFLSVAAVAAATAADEVDPAQLQSFPKNLARQHLGANLYQYSPTTQAYTPSQASAAWLDDDITTGWAPLSGKQYYLLAFPEAELVSNFELSGRAANGTISLYASDEPAPPTAKSWSLLAKDIPYASVNEKRLAKSFARAAKYLLIETDLADPAPIYSLNVYGNRPAVAYEIRNREQPIDAKAIFGPYTNEATAFNVTGLYAKSYVKPQEGQGSFADVQKAIDDNPETSVTIGGAQPAVLEVHSADAKPISRIAMEVNPGAKGRFDFFLSGDTAPTDTSKPTASLVLDGTSSRASVDFPATAANVVTARWTPANGSDAVKVQELNAFGDKTLAVNTVATGPDLVAERDEAGNRIARAHSGRGGKDGKDAKDAKEAANPEGIGALDQGPYLPGALGFPPTPTLRRIPPVLPPTQPPVSP
jgi:hypothetical protein